jgi:hypothetical protein
LKEEDHKSNPVVQRVKLIMSAGLMLVHARSRWPFKEDDVENIRPLVAEQHMSLNRTEDAALHEYIMKWVTVSADHIVILILLLALVVKFVFFENKEELAEQLRAHISTETAPSENKNRLFTMPLIRTTFFLSDNPKEEDGSLSRSKVEPFSPKHFRCRTRRQRSPNGLGQITLWKIVKGKQRHVRENVQECGGMSENIQRFEFRRVGLE